MGGGEETKDCIYRTKVHVLFSIPCEHSYEPVIITCKNIQFEHTVNLSQ